MKKSFKDMINKAIFIEEEDEVIEEGAKNQKEIQAEVVVTEILSEPEVKVEAVKEPEMKTEKISEPEVPTVKIEPKITPDYQPTVISYGTKITGNISCKADLKIDGVIEGDIQCDGAVVIKGKVKGNIKASTLTMEGATVVGNINCKGLCNILSTTNLQGDVKSSDVIMEGEIAGNIVADNKVSLKGSAVLDGNCTSAKIAVDEGAVIIGSIQTVVNKQ